MPLRNLTLLVQMCLPLPPAESQSVSTSPTMMKSDKIQASKTSTQAMPMENLPLNPFSISQKIKSRSISNITTLLFLSQLPCMSFQVMALENCMKNSQSSLLLSMARKSRLFINRIKPGIVCSEKQLQDMKNARLTQSPFTQHSSKTFNKFYCQNIRNKKDGTSSMLPGWTFFINQSKDQSTMMSNITSGCKPTLQPLMPSLAFLKKKEASSKSKKPKEKDNPTLNST